MSPKSVARLLNRNFVKRKGLELSKEVLWFSVGQRAAELPAVKVGGQKNSAAWPGSQANSYNECCSLATLVKIMAWPNFESLQFCGPLVYKDIQYL